MICQLRIHRIVIELLCLNGLLFGFTLPQGYVRSVGINCGPLCLCIYLESTADVCHRCGRRLHWGLHGVLFNRFTLCRHR